MGKIGLCIVQNTVMQSVEKIDVAENRKERTAKLVS